MSLFQSYNEKMSAMSGKVIISTGGLHEPHEIIDAIFAFDSHSESAFKGADPGKAFENVKKELRKACAQLGGNAVINCQFEYRMAIGNKDAQTVEIFAYGTAVKL